MARGLILGAALLAFSGCLFALVAALYPVWLAFRTESAESLCFHGWGIWQADYFQGQDLHTVILNRDITFFKCSGNTRSTWDAYCGPEPSPLLNAEKDPPDFARDMCTATNRAKVTSGATIALTLATSVVGLVLETTPVTPDHKREVGLALAGMGLSVLSILSSLATQIIMQTSPLFSEAHVDAFTAGTAGIPYDSYYSCSFQMPLHSIFRLLFPGTLQCLLPGPAFLCNLLVWIVMGLSSIFFGIAAYHARTQHLLDVGPSEHLSAEDEARKKRVYSLFGAAARRYSRLSPFTRSFVLVVVPFIVIMSVALFWGGFVFLGVQMISQATLEIIHRPPVHAQQQQQPQQPQQLLVPMQDRHHDPTSEDALALITEMLRITTATTGSSFDTLEEAVLHPPGAATSHLLLRLAQPWIATLAATATPTTTFVIFKDTINPFSFSPLTSLTYFARGGAYLVLVFTFGGVFLVPMIRVVIWIWYYYVPSDEINRGRVMTWQDWLGKWMLSQILIFGWLSFATGEKRHIYVPLGGGYVFHLHLVVGLSLGDGLGSWFYMLTTLCAFFIGQFWLVFHQYSVGWEEDRRAANAHAKMMAGMASSPTTATSATTPLLTPFGLMDTPYTGGAGSSSSTMPLTTHHGSRPLLRAIVEYGSTTDLVGSAEATTASSSAAAIHEQLRQPIIKRLGQFGSRTNLAVDLRQPPRQQQEQQQQQQHPLLNLDKPMHPFVEAMCDRVHAPVHGVRLRWTTFGKALMLMGFFLLGGITLVTFMVDICEVERDGFVTFVSVPPKQWKKSYSIVSIAAELSHAGWQSSSYEQQLFFAFFMLLVPMIRLVALAYLWLLPLTLEEQKRVFDWLEIAGAWSSLDVFWMCVIAMSVEMRKITDQLTDLQTPKLARLLDLVFGTVPGGFLGASISLKPWGFALLTLCVVVEKIVFYLVTEQAVTAISERQAETLLRSLAYSATAADETESGPSPPPMFDSTTIANATQGLLQSGAALFFSPAARYTIYPRTFYAGLPRFVWAKWFVKMGLLADADKVFLYGSASPTHGPVSSPGGGAAAVVAAAGLAQHLQQQPSVTDDFVLEETLERAFADDGPSAVASTSSLGGGPVEF